VRNSKQEHLNIQNELNKYELAETEADFRISTVHNDMIQEKSNLSKQA
jgi:hypothetical protein